MKPNRACSIGIVILTMSLLAPQFIQAQGTTYISDLPGGAIGEDLVASDHWLAIGFETGTNAAGYTLNSVQLEMYYASSNSSGFAVTLYTSTTTNPFGKPDNYLGSLTGSDDPNPSKPPYQGIYTYTASGLKLASSAYYLIVLSAATTSTTGAYQLGEGGPITSIDGWNTAFDYYSANSGASWLYGSGGQFAITATPVPEPSAEMLLSCGGILLLGFRCWHKSNSGFYREAK